MTSYNLTPPARGLFVVFWGRAPQDNPTADYQWRYVACENEKTGRELYVKMKDKLKPGWKINYANTGDPHAPLLPRAVERGIFEQRGGK